MKKIERDRSYYIIRRLGLDFVNGFRFKPCADWQRREDIDSFNRFFCGVLNGQPEMFKLAINEVMIEVLKVQLDISRRFHDSCLVDVRLRDL